MLTVGLQCAQFRSRHGVFAEEQVLGGDFEIDVACTLSDLPAALPDTQRDALGDMLGDTLGDTLDYGEVYAMCRDVMDEPVSLLETVVARILARLLARGGERLVRVELEVRKLHPPLGGRVAAAYVRRVWELGVAG